MAYVHTITTRKRMRIGDTVSQLIWYLFGIIEVIILARFILKLVGANTGATFTQFVYSISSPFMAPFQSVVSSYRISEAGAIEWNALIALIVYWLIAWGLSALFENSEPTRVETHQEVREVRDDIVD